MPTLCDMRWSEWKALLPLACSEAHKFCGTAGRSFKLVTFRTVPRYLFHPQIAISYSVCWMADAIGLDLFWCPMDCMSYRRGLPGIVRI